MLAFVTTIAFAATVFGDGLNDPANGLTSGSGWVGAGLLGAVLAWLLMVHLPAKDKQLKDKDDAHNVHVKEICEEHRQQVTDLIADRATDDKEKRADFRESLLLIVTHCKEEMEGLIGIIGKDFGIMQTGLASLREAIESRNRIMDEQLRHDAMLRKPVS